MSPQATTHHVASEQESADRHAQRDQDGEGIQSIEQIDRPGYRLYEAQVSEVIDLSPNFVRVRLSCDDFDHFGEGRKDQRIKVVFPNDAGGFPDLGPLDPIDASEGTWYTRWRELPAEVQPPVRTYTVRDVDRTERMVDVDFVRHGDTGVSGRWLASASRGDRLYVAGPDGRSLHCDGGIDFKPGGASRILLAGDETAVPAIVAICERLAPGITVRAFCEVPTMDDVLDVQTDAECQITWLPRNGQGHGELLIPTLAEFAAANPGFLSEADDDGSGDSIDEQMDHSGDDADEVLWDSPDGVDDGGFYAWLAGEASMVRALRRLLVRDHHIDRTTVAFMGYWRLGKAES